MVDRRYSGNYKPVAERLMAKIRFDPETHCMIFTGSVNNMGYGSFSGGTDLPGLHYAHRVAYVLWNGPIPEGMELDHRCMNPLCCNPQHVWAVTRLQNTSFQRKHFGDDHHMGSKTHCIHGHPFDEANTIVDAMGRRSCRTCRREASRRKRAANPCLRDPKDWQKRGVLPDETVRQIRVAVGSLRKIGKAFGVNPHTVACIRNGTSYRYVL